MILKCLIVTCARTREPAQGLSDLRGSKTGITYQYLPPQSGQVYQQNIPFGLDQSDPTGFQQNVIQGYQVLPNPQQNAFAKSNLPRNTVAKSNPQQNALGYPGVTATQTIPGLAQPQGEFSGKALLVPINMPYGEFDALFCMIPILKHQESFHKIPIKIFFQQMGIKMCLFRCTQHDIVAAVERRRFEAPSRQQSPSGRLHSCFFNWNPSKGARVQPSATFTRKSLFGSAPLPLWPIHPRLWGWQGDLWVRGGE